MPTNFGRKDSNSAYYITYFVGQDRLDESIQNVPICHLREDLFHKVAFCRVNKYEYKSIDKLLIYIYIVFILR